MTPDDVLLVTITGSYLRAAADLLHVAELTSDPEAAEECHRFSDIASRAALAESIDDEPLDLPQDWHCPDCVRYYLRPVMH